MLVHLALYLEALTRKNLLNKNIPNSSEYRMEVLSDEQYADLFVEEARDEDQTDSREKLLALLQEYGG